VSTSDREEDCEQTTAMTFRDVHLPRMCGRRHVDDGNTDELSGIVLILQIG
jgi:hypothetical protein